MKDKREEIKEQIEWAREGSEPVWLAVYNDKFISLEDLLEWFTLEQIQEADERVFVLDGIPYVPCEEED